MTIELINEKVEKNQHNSYYGYDLNLSLDEIEKIKDLANEVKKFYTDLESFSEKLPAGGPLDTHKLNDLIKHRIPNWTDKDIDNFQVVRSEFGEIIAQLTLEDCFETEFHLKRLKRKEVPLLPTRGIDFLGIEFDNEIPILVLGEVKVSTEKRNPPGVVHKPGSRDCLEQRIPELLSNKTIVTYELAYYLEHVSDTCKNIYLDIFNRFTDEESSLIIIGNPFLLRDAKAFNIDDLGNLLEYNSSENRKVRFVIVRVAEDINQLSKKVYEMAREE
ncbi:MAG: Hachiman antiphage defense system protein HamA [Halanaerobiales bacterium]